MNGYLLTKCRSEQQLLNDLAKLVASARGGTLGGGDAASKKTMELLRDLAVVYVSPAEPLVVPHSVVKDLSTLLAMLKDKKEDLRAARLVMCLLMRLIEQFERRYAQVLSHVDAPRTQSFELSVTVMTSLHKSLEASELGHASIPRQCAALRIFALLCRTFSGKSDVLLGRTKTTLLQTPAFVLLVPLAAGGKALSPADKKQLTSTTGKKDFPGLLASLGSAIHAMRFYVPVSAIVGDPSSQKIVDALVQVAFLPSCAASRHAAATLLSLFTSNLPDNLGAKMVIQGLEAFVSKFRGASLKFVGDSLATVYMLRLCGQISRLQVSDGTVSETTGKSVESSPAMDTFELLDFSGVSNSPKRAHAPPSPIAKSLKGVTVNGALTDRMRDWIVDLVKISPDANTRTIVMAAIEEAVTESSQLSVTVFDSVSTTLLKVFREPNTAGTAPLLHRLCRVTQFAAEGYDRAVVTQQQTPPTSPLDRVAQSIAELVSHGNAFVACEAIRAQIWLLSRHQADPEVESAWSSLVSRLVALPVDRILPETRHALAEALFRRAMVGAASSGIDVAMLGHCLTVTLRWVQSRPCEWHAAMLDAVWHTALQSRHEPQPATDARRLQVLGSITAVLDTQNAAKELRPTLHLVQQSALVFLCHRNVISRLIPSSPSEADTARSTLFLTLSKHMMLAPFVSRRIAAQALGQLHRELKMSREGQILSDQIAALFRFLQKDPSFVGQHEGPNNCVQVVSTKIHSLRAQQTLGIRGLLADEMRKPLAAAQAGRMPHNGLGFQVGIPVAPIAMPNVNPAAPPPISTGFDGLF